MQQSNHSSLEPKLSTFTINHAYFGTHFMRIARSQCIIVIFLLQLMLTSSTIVVSQSKPLVVASASIFQDMAIQIGGEYVDVRTIVPIGGDPHLYEPTPSDAQLVQKSNLILINGLTFEGWIAELIANSGTKAQTVRITEDIIPIASDLHAGATDPHAWMTASNGLIYIKNIYNALKTVVDEKNWPQLEKNYEAYKLQLEELDQYIFKKIKEIPEGQRILVTSHDAFNYYGSRYGLTLSAVMGISTESDAQTADMKRVIDNIVTHKIPAIFIETTINPKLIKQIAEDHHVKIGGELYADSIGPEGSSGESYIKMLKSNTNTIVAALAGISVEKTKLDNDTSGLNFSVMAGIILFLLATIIYMIRKLDHAQTNKAS